MVEPSLKNFQIKATELLRKNSEVNQKVDPKKLMHISHHELETTLAIQELSCTFCEGVANKAVACLQCSQHYCESCIDKYLETNTVCPSEGCKEIFVKKDPSKLKFSKIEFDKMKIKCQTADCSEKLIPYNQIVQHREFCYLEKQNCIFGCGDGVLYKGREQHFNHA